MNAKVRHLTSFECIVSLTGGARSKAARDGRTPTWLLSTRRDDLVRHRVLPTTDSLAAQVPTERARRWLGILESTEVIAFAIGFSTIAGCAFGP
ncbi:hypothetical protein CH289_18105 [Rhodococcus sp. RS1C4]|nr:hypothetical protein CH289_18105 [Rhodococcus sp. RS1C4]